VSGPAERPTDATAFWQRVDDLLVARFGRGDAQDEAPSAVFDALSAAGVLATEDRAVWERAFAAGVLPEADMEAPAAERPVAARVHELVERRAAESPESVFGVLEMLRDLELIPAEEALEWQRKVLTGSLGLRER
jgi:hypothetical protein